MYDNTQTNRQRPHVVFVVLDTQRLDRLGCYGYERNTSPNLDAFARGATLFERAISPAQWTIPTHASFFSGEYPSTHMTIHGPDALSTRFKTLAERLRDGGYQATGFCNNPLVGILDNGFRRGFDAFFNYGGAFPSKPTDTSADRPGIINRVRASYQRAMHAFSHRVQNLFTEPNRIFRLAMNPVLVPLWTRHARFKGDTKASINDVTAFIREKMGAGSEQPHFLFVNLMQTHLPFTPPQSFIDAFAPIMNEKREAAAFVRTYNRAARSWMFPLKEPLTELQAQTLSDMYDAEVAYQDHLLAHMLAALDEPEHRERTMVIFVSDHGTMLGEHQLVGHGLGVYQELAHVPLIIRYPGQRAAHRVSQPLSATRIFHTVLDVAGGEPWGNGHVTEGDIKALSLARVSEESQGPVFSEAYPPDTVLEMMESHVPALIDTFHARSTVRAVYQNQYKLIDAEGAYQRLYALDADPKECCSLDAQANAGRISDLSSQLETFVDAARERRPENWSRSQAGLTDEAVLERLRGLGYLN